MFLSLFSFRHRARLPFKYTWHFVAFFSANIIIAAICAGTILIDVLAGIALAALGFALSIFVSPRETALREKRGLSRQRGSPSRGLARCRSGRGTTANSQRFEMTRFRVMRACFVMCATVSSLLSCAAATQGSIGAILVQSQTDGRVTVREAPGGYPAAQGGLRVGDEILLIDGRDVRSMSPISVHLALEGEPGTT